MSFKDLIQDAFGGGAPRNEAERNVAERERQLAERERQLAERERQVAEPARERQMAEPARERQMAEPAREVPARRPRSDAPAPRASVGGFAIAVGAALACLFVVIGVVAGSVRAAQLRLENPDLSARPLVAIAQQAEVAYCTKSFKEVLERVLHSCGLSTGAERRGCKPSDIKTFAAISDDDFNALFHPLKGRGGVLQFDMGSDKLDDAAKKLLDERWVDRKGARYFFVVARASKTGTPAANRSLSHRRANSVLFHLEETSGETKEELSSKVGLLWLGNEYAQLSEEYCQWPVSRTDAKCGRRAHQSQRLRFVGGLPAMNRLGSRAGRRVRGWMLLALGAPLACDDAPKASAPPPSRVEAVVAAKPAADPSASTSAAKASQRASEVRPLLCGSQLDSAGQAFKPALPPRDVAAPGAAHLPKLALGKKGSWTWVNFWAAWCAPCKEELPILLAWQKRFAGKLDFAFVSLDDDARQLQAFIGAQPEAGLRQSYWLEEGPARTAWLDALGMETEPELPYQLLIDPNGQLRCRVQGAVDERDLASLEKILGGT